MTDAEMATHASTITAGTDVQNGWIVVRTKNVYMVIVGKLAVGTTNVCLPNFAMTGVVSLTIWMLFRDLQLDRVPILHRVIPHPRQQTSLPLPQRRKG